MARFHACRVSTAAVLVLAGLVSGCGSQPTAFCAAVRRGAAGFNPQATTADVVHALDGVIAAVAPRDRAELRVVRQYLVVISHPEVHQGDAARAILDLAVAAKRLDTRLRHECGVPLDTPPRLFLGGAAASTAKGARP